jgi:hypothetical protein
MSAIPFTVYDFFAYLSSGSIIVLTFDYLFGMEWILKEKIPSVRLFVLLFLSYIVGHVVSNLSSYFIESLFTRKVLSPPTTILLGKSKSKYWKIIFPGYYKSLPAKTIERVKANASLRKFEGDDDALFLHTFSVVTQEEIFRDRLDEFRNLYGFSRNLAFALLFSSLFLFIRFFSHQKPRTIKFPALLTILGLAMIYRYLKFYRQYSYQLFITYSELPIDEGGNQNEI